MRRIVTATVALVVMAIAAAPEISCIRRAPGTCAEDIDCSPGHDCKAGACVRRERMKFGAAATSPDAVPVPAPALGTAVTPVDTTELAPQHPDAGPDAHGQRRPRTTPAPVPAVPPSVPPPIPPAPGREPLWKQRLKNS